MSLLQAALTWYDAGCSVIPILPDGTKKPLIQWKPYTQAQPSREDVGYWFNPSSRSGIGVICGAVSGGLEMLELEGRAASGADLEKIYSECDKRNISWLFATLLEQGYAEWTPSGGLHFLYRITDHVVPGNTKVARRPANEAELAEKPDDKVKVLAETRGEGGYVIVAPTGGTVHPTGASWSTVAGDIGVIPTVEWADRCLLHEAIHAALDEMPEIVLTPSPPRIPVFQRDGLSPGDDFTERATWEEILTPHGWRVTEYHGNETFWIRPGKQFDGRGSHSATTGFKGDGAQDRLYVFSTSTVFDAEKPYNKFAAYTLLEHNGQFAAAAKELSRRGYGTRRNGPASVAQSAAVDVAAGVVPVPVQAAEVVVSQQAVIPLAAGLPAVHVDTLMRCSWDDRGAGKMFADTFHGILRHVSEEDSWRLWDGKRWSKAQRNQHEWAMTNLAEGVAFHARTMKENEDPAAESFKKFADKMSGMQRLKGIPTLARSNPKLAATVEDFDTHRHLVTVDNGILNLHDGTLQPHDPKLMLSKKLNATFNPTTGTGRWGTFMEQVLPDPAVRGYLQRALGYTLLGDADQRALFLLHGDSGSGKSQVLEGVQALLGDFGSTIPANTFEPNKGSLSDSLHKLRGSRMVTQSELNENSTLNEGLIKAATGGDTLSTRALYGSYIDWRPQFVIFLATNFLPRVSSSDNAIWRRVKPIKFEQKFIDDDGNPLNPDMAGIGVRIAAEEPEGVLNWLLEGIAAYRRDGLTPPDRVREWTQSYREDVDTVRQFLNEGQDEGRIKVEEGQEVGFRELYRAYDAWCRDNQLRPVSSRKFNQSMEAGKWERKRREHGVMWLGVGLIGFLAEAQGFGVGRR